jgi:hypothetical protein
MMVSFQRLAIVLVKENSHVSAFLELAVWDRKRESFFAVGHYINAADLSPEVYDTSRMRITIYSKVDAVDYSIR